MLNRHVKISRVAVPLYAKWDHPSLCVCSAVNEEDPSKQGNAPAKEEASEDGLNETDLKPRLFASLGRSSTWGCAIRVLL